MNTTKTSITLEQQVYAKLPSKNKSAYINLVLKQHFQQEGFDQLYDKLKYRLLRDKDMNEWITITAREVR